MGAVKKIVKKVVKKILPTPSVAEPTPPPAPAPVAPTPPPPAPVAPTPVAASPQVADPAPVTEEAMETQETDQAVQRKKKGRKPLILTSAQGLGGSPDTYSPTLLG
jgi:2-oxoglutarate dehydrogenase E2 component (dihydrolipoamide succinyltransferase)